MSTHAAALVQLMDAYALDPMGGGQGLSDYAKQHLPTEGGVSRGTLMTVLENINHPGVRRVNRELVTAHPAESSAEFVVAGKKFTGVYNLGMPIYLRLDGLQVSITSKPTRFFPV
jgi:hypothetical protein